MTPQLIHEIDLIFSVFAVFGNNFEIFDVISQGKRDVIENNIKLEITLA